MKVYAVEECGGFCDCLYCYIKHIFSDAQKAQQYINEQEAYEKTQLQRSQKCENCALDHVDLDKVKNKDLFVQKARKRCSDFAIDDDGEYLTCYRFYNLEDVPTFNIVEYDVE